MQDINFIDLRRIFLFMRKTLYENILMILITLGASSIFVLLPMVSSSIGPIDDF